VIPAPTTESAALAEERAIAATVSMLDAIAALAERAVQVAVDVNEMPERKPLPVAYGTFAMFEVNGMSEYAFRLWCSARSLSITASTFKAHQGRPLSVLFASVIEGLEISFHRAKPFMEVVS